MKEIFKEFTIKENVEVRNRLVIAPMTTWAANDDLSVADDEIMYYKARSKGVGMVITGCTFFEPNGQGFVNEFYAGDDSYIPSLKKLADGIKEGGAKAILQVFHAGRMGLINNERLVSASNIKPTHHPAVADISQVPEPEALTEEEIQSMLEGFHDVTVRAIKAGFDGVEIHGANTFLIQQFFSRESNRRSDYWGGDLKERMRFPLAVIERVNNAVNAYATSSFIIGYRFSPEEIEIDGITLEETLAFVDTLCNQPIDYLHISTSSYKITSLRDKNDQRIVGNLVAETINGRKVFIGVGGIKSKSDVTKAIQDIGYDMVAVGQASVTDPDFAEKLKKNEPLITALRMHQLDEQKIPKKMASVLAMVPNWFEVIKG